MFDLEKEIKKWKKGFARNGTMEDALLNDMEWHLREVYEVLTGEGLGAAEAFQQAIKQVGSAPAIAAEYGKNQELTLNRRSPWRPARFMPALVWSYIKIARRKISRQKTSSIINITGLAAGLTCVLFILLWVQDELSFNGFHINAGTIYRVEQDKDGPGDQDQGQGRYHISTTPVPLGPVLQSEIPEIKLAVRVAYIDNLLVRYQENAFYENRIMATDPRIFQMFTFPLSKGDPATALSRPDALVITEGMARKYFGEANPLGQAMTINNSHAFIITGVLRQIPFNSSLQFDMLVPVDFLKTLGEYDDSMEHNILRTYVQLDLRAEPAVAAEKITRLVRDRVIRGVQADPAQMKKVTSNPESCRQFETGIRTRVFSLMPLDRIRLFSLSGYDRINPVLMNISIFSILALFILFTAGINFLNLATAHAAKRAKEIGLRKVAGARRVSIIIQFYGESIMTAFLAGAVSLVLGVLCLPMFNTLTGKLITLNMLLSGKVLIGIFAVTLLTGVAAGSYPALFLSSLPPVPVMKGCWAAGGTKSILLRKILIILQFSLSIFLLIVTGSIVRQINFLRNKDLGYTKDQLIYLPLRGDTRTAYTVFKENLLKNPRILNVTATYQTPTSYGMRTSEVQWDGKSPALNRMIAYSYVDFDYTETLKIDLVSGRPFSRTSAMDDGRTFLVNEEVVKLMGIAPASAVGRRFNLGTEGTIAGVMKNFHFESVRFGIEPFAVLIDRAQVNFVVVRLTAEQIPAVLEDVKQTWRRFFPQYPFEYRFFDEDFAQEFIADERLEKIMTISAVMAVFIACLGLAGMVSYMMQQRTKEIGIRKVLGSSSAGIAMLLVKDYVFWVMAANGIAWPAAYFLMQRWLQEFAYRIQPAWWLFALAGTGVLAAAMMTVCGQVARTALINPAESLKHE